MLLCHTCLVKAATSMLLSSGHACRPHIRPCTSTQALGWEQELGGGGARQKLTCPWPCTAAYDATTMAGQGRAAGLSRSYALLQVPLPITSNQPSNGAAYPAAPGGTRMPTPYHP